MVAARVDEVPTTQTFKRLLKEIGAGDRKPDDEYGTVQKPFPKPDLIGAGQFHGCNNQKNGKDEGRESETAVYPIVGAVGSHVPEQRNDTIGTANPESGGLYQVETPGKSSRRGNRTG